MAPQATSTARARLAQLAALAAGSVPGSAGLHPEPGTVLVTDVAGERLRGVAAAAAGSGRYDLTLCVVARLVPLHELADGLRADIRSRAVAEGLDGALGDIEVRVTEMVAEAGA